MEGFLLIDKPTGITSHDVVARIRRALQPPTSNHQPLKVGHAGTLDPFATGLLIVGVGRAATREMEKLVGLDKAYEAVFVLGAKSDTDDRTGRIEEAPLKSLPLTKGRPTLSSRSKRELEGVLKRFTGEIDQVPPAYSAIKIGGKKMYEEARKGKPMKAKPRRVMIYLIEINCNHTPTPPPAKPDPAPPGSPPSAFAKATADKSGRGGIIKLPLTIHCSSGTYIRALARDLGEALGGGGYVDELRRTTIGQFSINEAIPIQAQVTSFTKAPGVGKACDLNLFLSQIIPIPQFLARL